MTESMTFKKIRRSQSEEEKIAQEFHKGRVDQVEEGGSSLWLVTFTDVMALMLTFFVLLYSMSVPVEEEWEEVTQGITKQFSPTFAEQWNKGSQDSINIDKIDFTEALDLGYLQTIILNSMGKDQRLQNIKLIPQKESLIVSVPVELLFESGQSEVSDEGKQVLFTLGNTMTRIRNRIEVIGHTDPRPIQTSQSKYPSNWELSLARAGSVASVIRNAGYEREVIIRGLSSARYEDLPESMDEEERLSLARRVDIVVMKDDGSKRNAIDIFSP